MWNHLLARSTLAVVLLALLVCTQPSHARPRAATSVSDPTAPLTLAGSFSGVMTSLAVSGNLAYVGEGARLLILDVSAPSQPVIQSYLPVGHVVTVEVSGSLAYVLTRDALRLVDVSNPQQPVLRGSYGLPEGAATTLTLQGTDALVGTDRALLVVGASDLVTPRLRGRLTLPGRVYQIAAADGWAYVAGVGGLHHVDLSNLDAPALRATYVPDPTVANPEARCVNLVGKIAYARFLGGGRFSRFTKILDVSAPQTPAPVGDLPDGTCIHHVSGAVGYAIVGDSELDLYDLSAPKTPKLQGTYYQFLYDSRPVADLRAVGTRIYVTTHDTLTVLNAANPSQVGILGTYTAQIQWPPSPISKGYAAVGWGSVLKMVDLHDPAHIRHVGGAELGAVPNALRIDGDLLGLTLNDKSLRLFNIRNPAQPALLSTLPISGTKPTLVGLSGGFALVELGEPLGRQVQIIAISNPASPTPRGLYKTSTSWIGDTRVRDGLLYIVEGLLDEGALKIVDIHNPDQPGLIGQVAVRAQALTLAGDYAYLTGDRLSVVDVHDPAHPRVRGEQLIGLAGSANQISVVDGLAYVAFWNGLRIYDVRNPAGPLLRANTPLNPWSVYAEGGRVYVHDAEDGLVVLDLHTERFSSPVYLPRFVR